MSYAFNRASWNALAARNDDNPSLAMSTTGRPQAACGSRTQLRAVASMGTSFQAPPSTSWLPRLWQSRRCSPSATGALKVGLKYHAGGLSLGAVVYHNDIQGFISPANNVQSALAVLRGVTFSGEWAAGDSSYALS